MAGFLQPEGNSWCPMKRRHAPRQIHHRQRSKESQHRELLFWSDDAPVYRLPSNERYSVLSYVILRSVAGLSLRAQNGHDAVDQGIIQDRFLQHKYDASGLGAHP